MNTTESSHDTAFELAVSNIRFGRGITREVGMDLADLGLKRVMVLADPTMAKLEPVAAVLESLRRERVDFALFDRVRVEPTDKSMWEAVEFARDGNFDGFVAVGGGSAMDTAKVADLLVTYPAPLMSYVNAPLGEARPVPGPLKPLVAIPTTAGTGSETTGTAIFDLSELHVKTGIAHRRLKPMLGIVDPDNTATMPPLVAASTGLDVLCHALESYTAIPFDTRPQPARPNLRPAYQGRNPISDLWSERAIQLVADNLLAAWRDPADLPARTNMLLASTYAGIGFGNAGVHLPHGMSYPVSGMIHGRANGYRPAGYPTDEPMVPHGISVCLNAPAVFRFTGTACPERHLHGAELLGADVAGRSLQEAGDALAERFVHFMKLLGLPNGLAAIGYTAADCPALAKGTLPQHRVTKLSPRPASEADLVRLFQESLTLWS
ncbi:MAG: hydroxyacid-oxoacid transhydrogenase [Pirellulales bacterium]